MKANERRILKLLGGNDFGGQFICDLQFLSEWKQKGVIVDAYIVGDGPSVEEYSKFLNEYKILPKLSSKFGGGIATILKGIWNSYIYPKKIRKELSLTDNYDAIVYQSQGYVHLASTLSKQLNCNSYWYLPNSINKKFAKLYYNVILRIRKVIPIANSKYTKNSLGKICAKVIYPGFSKERLTSGKSLSFRKDFNIPDNTLVFGTAARLSQDKAQDILIEAFTKILGETSENKREICLIIAGITDDQEFANLCRRLAANFPNHIYFQNNVREMGKFYNSIDVYVNSRRNAEPFGISIVEAMSFSKPVISNNIGGPSEIIVEGKTGWFFKAPKVEDYYNQLKSVIASRNELKKIGENGYKRSFKFSTELNAANMLKYILK